MQRALQDFHAVLQRLGEALLLRLEPLRHAFPCLRQLGIGRSHDAREIRDDAMEERLLLSKLVAVADGAADDAAKHVAAAFVAWDNPVHHKEGTRADMIGDDFQRIIREIFRGPPPPPPPPPTLPPLALPPPPPPPP